MRSSVLIIGLAITAPFSGTGCSKQVSYLGDVQPLLDEYCVKCHDGKGEGSEKSGFVMTSYANVMTGTRFGQVVVPGDSESSTLYRIISGKVSPKIDMPPTGPESVAVGRGHELKASHIATIQKWIDQGALNN
ncbi:MAG: hypothetical protein OEU44_08530 [Gammaproteobacteria bacterium]|nr:hypothetical protein [Gammaproteobacteria bacterium]